METERLLACTRLEMLLAKPHFEGPASTVVRLAKVYLTLLRDVTHPIDPIDPILVMESMQPSAKGDLYLALARHADKFQATLVTKYLDEADAHYSACNNTFGKLETSLLRYSQPLSDLHIRVSKLNSIIEEFIASDYPALLPGASIKLSKAVLGVQSGALCSDEHRAIEFSCRRKVLQSAEQVG